VCQARKTSKPGHGTTHYLKVSNYIFNKQKALLQKNKQKAKKAKKKNAIATLMNKKKALIFRDVEMAKSEPPR
jgi:hypothetical protein